LARKVLGSTRSPWISPALSPQNSRADQRRAGDGADRAFTIIKSFLDPGSDVNWGLPSADRDHAAGHDR